MKSFKFGGLDSSNRQFLSLFVLTASAMVLATVCPDSFAQSSGFAIPAKGQSIGAISNNIANSLSGFNVLVMAGSYATALCCGLLSVFKWKAHGDQPDRVALKVPVTYMAVAAAAAALPEVLGTGISTIWGANANIVSPP